MAKLPKGKIYQTDYTDLSTRVDSQTIIDSPLWVLDNSAPSEIGNYLDAYNQAFYWEGSTSGYVVDPRMVYSNPFTSVSRPNFSRPEDVLSIYRATFGARNVNGAWHFDLYIKDSSISGDYIHILFALKSAQTVFDTSTWDTFNATGFNVTDAGSPVNMGVEVFDSALHPAVWENNWVVNSDGTDIRYFANEVISSGAAPMTTDTFEFPFNLGLSTTTGEIFQGSLSSYAVIDSPFLYLPHMPGTPFGSYHSFGSGVINATSNHPEWWPYVWPASGVTTPVTEHFSKHSSLSYSTYVGQYNIAAKRQWYNPTSALPWLNNINDTFDPRIVKSDWHGRKVEKHWTFALWTNTVNQGNVPWNPYNKIPYFNINAFMYMDSQIGFRLKEGQTVFDTSTWEPAVTSTSSGPYGQNGSFVANWDAGAPIQIRAVAHNVALHPADLKNNWLVNSDGTELQFFYESGVADTGLAPMVAGLDEFTDPWNPPPPGAGEAPTSIEVVSNSIDSVTGLKLTGQPGAQEAPTDFRIVFPPEEPAVIDSIIISPKEESKVSNLNTFLSPKYSGAPTNITAEALIMFDDILDQIASMLGADQWEDLPKIDRDRVKIVANQAYRECYAPIDGHRPRWASRKMSVSFNEDQQSVNLPKDVIDIEKVPVLAGHGPLSPMNARTDEIAARSHYSGDFRPIGGFQGAFPSIDMDKPEKDRPIWYYIDQTDEGFDNYIVVPRLVLYPIPNKEYTVDLVANVMPVLLNEGDSPRLPGDAIWDIMLPIAQYKLLTDPRYNGDNREVIVQSAREARRKLKHFSSPQKQRTIRIVRRKGW